MTYFEQLVFKQEWSGIVKPVQTSSSYQVSNRSAHWAWHRAYSQLRQRIHNQVSMQILNQITREIQDNATF